MTTTAITFRKRATDEGWYYTSPAPKRELLAHVRGLARTRLKEASIGGEQETSFEQAFASLAYAYLKDKSPRLLDYVVGFQLVDRNEDNTKAMGVFGFKVGEQWLYAPTFFLNGDLKGHELLYIKNQDSFIPMKENWVNYLISRKPHLLGEASSRDTHQLGGMPSDLSRLTHPPGAAKYGADAYRPGVQGWCREFLPFVGAAAVSGPGAAADRVFAKHAGLRSRLALKAFLTEDIGLLKAAYDLACAYPLIKRGFDAFYGKDFFLTAAEALREKAASLLTKRAAPAAPARRASAGGSLIPDDRPADPVKSGALQVFYADRELARGRVRPAAGDLDDAITKLAEQSDKALKADAKNENPGGFADNKAELTDAEREKLLHDGVLIRDHRDPHAVSMVYNTQVRVELVNPGETGLYEVLEKPGDFDQMLVVVNPQTNRGGQTFSTVVRVSDPKNWLNTHQTNLWVKCNTAPDRPKFKDWFDKLSGTDSLQKKGTYLVIGPNGAGTTPFVVTDDLGDGTYRVNFNDYCEFGNDRPRGLPRVEGDRWGTYDADYGYVSTYNALLRLNDKDGSQLRAVGGELSVPKNFKVLKIEDPPKPKKTDDGTLLSCCTEMPPTAERSDPKKPVKPGNILDVQLLLHEKTAGLTVMDLGGNEVYLKHPYGADRLTKTAALVRLVAGHGFTEFAVRQMFKEAAVKKTVAYRVKYAEPFQSALAGGPTAPAFPQPLTGMERVGYGAYPATYPQEQMTQVPELAAGNTDPTVYDPFQMPDQGAVQVAQQAAQSGQKEVFDTAMISGMLKAVRQDSLVDRYLGDLMKALDKLGRILFMFYWHQEEFEDRYGKQDLPELEDSLRNAFEVLGDVCLFLKEKQVGNFQELQGVGDPNIEQAARN